MTARKLKDIWKETKLGFSSALSSEEIYRRIKVALSTNGNFVTGPDRIDEFTLHYDVQNQNNKYIAGIDLKSIGNSKNYVMNLWTKNTITETGIVKKLADINGIITGTGLLSNTERESK